MDSQVPRIPGLTFSQNGVRTSPALAQESAVDEKTSSSASEHVQPDIPTADNNASNLKAPSPGSTPQVAENIVEPLPGQMEVDGALAVDAPSPPSLTSGLEALIGGLDPSPIVDTETTIPEVNAEQALRDEMESTQEPVAEAVEGEQKEWESDSSPYESSSESSSDDSDEEDDKDYKVLGPEETARLLMEMEGGSDDEGDGKARGGASGGQIRTKNEIPEEVIPKPDVTITQEMKIEELGNVEFIVENTIVIKANTTGEYRVLEVGSVLCTSERKVLAAVADLIGNVHQPRYTAKFSNEDEIKADGLGVGSTVYYSPDHSTYVFTEAIKNLKGTDASNWHDEEAGDDEMEFSDDEKEAEYKRQLKQKKRAGRGGNQSTNGIGNHTTANESTLQSTPTELNYDEDDDGPYRPLARPPGFGQGGPSTPSQETGFSGGFQANRNSYRGGRGDFRGRGSNRGSRGRGYDRGGRGNRAGYRDAANTGTSYSPHSQQQFGQQQYSQQQHGTGVPNFFPPPPPQFTQPGFVPPPPPQYQQPGFVPPPPPQFQQAVGGHPNNPQYPFQWSQNNPPVPQGNNPQAVNGAYFNPAFFGFQNQTPNQGP